MFCVGNVADALKMSAGNVYRLLRDSGILMEYIVPGYDVLHTFSKDYLVEDIVSGGIADDKVFNTIDLYFAGEMSKEDALGRLAFEYPNHQICILNQNVILHHLKFKKATEITIEASKNDSK